MTRIRAIAENSTVQISVLGFILVGMGTLCGAWVSQVGDTRVNAVEISNLKARADKSDNEQSKIVDALHENTAELRAIKAVLKQQ